jgi:ATP-dependent helicase/nuclease subunit B
MRVARWFVAEESRRTDVAERFVEGVGSLAVTPGFQLSARADRLDRLADGRLAIVDYKSGTPPSVDEVLSLSPQLLIEALIAEAGGFAGLGPMQVERVEYYHLSGRRDGGEACPRGFRPASKSKPAVTLPEALAVTEGRLKALAAFYARPEAQYLSRKIPRRGRQFTGDYDHLGRVAEWAVAESDEEEP